MKLIKFIFAGFVLIAFFFSCYYDKEESLYPQIIGCDTTNVTFKSSVSTILGSYCIHCHGNATASAYGNGIKLQDYKDVKSNITKVYGSISHRNGYYAMPKGGGKLGDCMIQTIKIWMDAGSPDN